MHLSIFSKFQMNNGVRLQLPLLNESKLRQFFNLRRAVFMAELPIAGQEQPLLLLNTHLSAFSGGDDTLTRQISALTKQLKKADHDKTPWVLAGDFNALPPNDDPNRLGADASHYGVPSAMTPLFQEYQPSVSLAELEAHPESWGTYIPPNNQKADRTIDYIFLSDRLTSQTFTTLNEHTEISDHLPLLMEFEVR